MKCLLAGKCSGCSWIGESDSKQKSQKIDFLTNQLKSVGIKSKSPISFIETTKFHSRDRVDLTFKGTNLGVSIGLYDKSKSEIVDIKSCPQMSEPLEAWFLQFRRSVPNNIKIGSFRLRVSPSGKRGVWLDLPNLVIKELLEDGEWLKSLLSISVVEVGQKRKLLSSIEGKLKLIDPTPDKWFETYAISKDLTHNPSIGFNIDMSQKLRSVPIWMSIGGFSQPGFAVNRTLIETLLGITIEAKANTWTELGSGSGNLTIPLASTGVFVTAVEIDQTSLKNLEKSASEAGLSSKIKLMRSNFHRPTTDLIRSISTSDALLVDPPRSGLGNLIDQLQSIPKNERPKTIIYVSCFAESFAQDCAGLKKSDYEIASISIVDQFPQTPHFETVALLKIN